MPDDLLDESKQVDRDHLLSRAYRALKGKVCEGPCCEARRQLLEELKPFSEEDVRIIPQRVYGVVRDVRGDYSVLVPGRLLILTQGEAERLHRELGRELKS